MFKLFFRMVDILIVVPLNQQLNSKKQKHNQYIYIYIRLLPSNHVCTNSGVFVIFKQMKCFRCLSLKTE